jgi:hypothetical protein
MYTLNKNQLHLKNCVIYKSILDDKIFCINSSSNKTSAFIFHTYFRVLYEMHSVTFLQQLRKVKGFEYFEHRK